MSVVAVSLALSSCTSVRSNDGQQLYFPAYDSKKSAKTKIRLAFEKYEKLAPRYQIPVTNWNPSFIACGAITNLDIKSPSSGDGVVGCHYFGMAGENWIEVKFYCFKSSRAAHEYLMEIYSDTPTGGPFLEDETTNPKERIGFRCFWWKRTAGEAVEFICNNVYVDVCGKGVRVETLARDLERQILALSGTSLPAK
ncbi:MAG: hypothetical protein NTY53_12310 [Kiritimatiellaeota bacterium]|nr:hypothetical protein [Kiritimatiellota bacterium]